MTGIDGMPERRSIRRSLVALSFAASTLGCPVRTAAGPENAVPPPPPGPSAAETEVEGPAHADADTHLEGTWLAARAERLGLGVDVARARDAGFAAGPTEDGLWWDEQLAREVWGLWTDLCEDCHGGSRSLKKVLAFRPPPRGWIEKDGLFFTRSRDPRMVFRVIAEGAKSGKPEIKDMPAWQKRLSNEQMWGLVYFVRSASKKKGGDLH